nr:arylamine N-acetyltransferase [Psychrobacter sp. PraFG1]UTT87688.1 arylamine N-acetyltransferase [Psychrobacter sp. PraFG1]
MDTEQIVKNYLDTLNIDQDIKSLEDISTLAKAHLQTYAFGNPKILLGEAIPIDLESVYNNLVVSKRAGYCFEHNKLMYEVLKAKGFEVTQHLARVVNNQSPPTIPMTHRVTVLYYQGEKYLVDVGVGFRSPTVVIKIGDTQPTLSHLGIEYKVLPVDADKNVYTMQLMEKMSLTMPLPLI